MVAGCVIRLKKFKKHRIRNSVVTVQYPVFFCVCGIAAARRESRLIRLPPASDSTGRKMAPERIFREDTGKQNRPEGNIEEGRSPEFRSQRSGGAFCGGTRTYRPDIPGNRLSMPLRTAPAPESATCVSLPWICPRRTAETRPHLPPEDNRRKSSIDTPHLQNYGAAVQMTELSRYCSRSACRTAAICQLSYQNLSKKARTC